MEEKEIKKPEDPELKEILKQIEEDNKKLDDLLKDDHKITIIIN